MLLVRDGDGYRVRVGDEFGYISDVVVCFCGFSGVGGFVGERGDLYPGVLVRDFAVDADGVAGLYRMLTSEMVSLLQSFSMWYSRELLGEDTQFVDGNGVVWHYGGVVDTGLVGVYCCTYGHRLRYVHIAYDSVRVSLNMLHSMTLDAMVGDSRFILFGVDCVSDFFDIDKGHLSGLQSAQRWLIQAYEELFVYYSNGVALDAMASLREFDQFVRWSSGYALYGCSFGKYLSPRLYDYWVSFVDSGLVPPRELFRQVWYGLMGHDLTLRDMRKGTVSELNLKNDALVREFFGLGGVKDITKYRRLMRGLVFKEWCGVYAWGRGGYYRDGGRSREAVSREKVLSGFVVHHGYRGCTFNDLYGMGLELSRWRGIEEVVWEPFAGGYYRFVNILRGGERGKKYLQWESVVGASFAESFMECCRSLLFLFNIGSSFDVGGCIVRDAVEVVSGWDLARVRECISAIEGQVLPKAEPSREELVAYIVERVKGVSLGKAYDFPLEVLETVRGTGVMSDKQLRYIVKIYEALEGVKPSWYDGGGVVYTDAEWERLRNFRSNGDIDGYARERGFRSSLVSGILDTVLRTRVVSEAQAKYIGGILRI